MTGKNSNIKIKDMRTYIEDDYQTAYLKARKELGSELVQIERKEIKVGGFFGLFSKKKVQVIFGVEAGENLSGSKYNKGLQTSNDDEILKFLRKIQSDSDGDKKTQQQNQNFGNYNNNPANNNTYKPQPVFQQNNIGANNQSQNIQNVYENKNKKETEDINELTEKIKKEVTEDIKKELFKQGLGSDKISDKSSNKYELLEKKLRKNDIDEEFITEIIEYIKSKNYKEDDYNRGLKEYFINNIGVYEELDKRRIIMLVGPTGVGKTTSCAKIAANKWKEEKEIAFITADTYRLEAVTQLKGYANIMKVSVEVINKPEELNIALEKFKGKDYVIMDTAGRSPRNRQQMDELKEYVKTTRNTDIDVYLVVSATSKLEVLYDIIENFKYIGFTSLIITKIDETTSIGSVLSVYKKYKVPISYITTGQRVPDDIELANKERLAEIFIERLK